MTDMATIGPWFAQPGTTTGQEVVAPNAPKTRRVVARCGGSDREANACLIAAAPDLLTALKSALSQLENYENAISGESFNDTQINSAIAKAEGR